MYLCISENYEDLGKKVRLANKIRTKNADGKPGITSYSDFYVQMALFKRQVHNFQNNPLPASRIGLCVSSANLISIRFGGNLSGG